MKKLKNIASKKAMRKIIAVVLVTLLVFMSVAFASDYETDKPTLINTIGASDNSDEMLTVGLSNSEDDDITIGTSSEELDKPMELPLMAARPAPGIGPRASRVLSYSITGNFTINVNVYGFKSLTARPTTKGEKPGILTAIAENTISGSAKVQNTAWIQDPSSVELNLISGKVIDRKVTYFRLTDKATGWSPVSGGINYYDHTLNGSTMTVSFNELFNDIYKKDPAVYRLDIEMTCEKGLWPNKTQEKLSTSIIVNPETLTPIITFIKDKAPKNQDPDAVVFDFVHNIKDLNKDQITQSWVLTGTGKTWTGNSQEEFDALFATLKKGDYTITLNGEANSKFGYKIKNSKSDTFKLTKDKLNLAGLITPVLDLKDGYIKNSTHYNPETAEIGYIIAAENLHYFPNLASASGKLVAKHPASGQSFTLYDSTSFASLQEATVKDALTAAGAPEGAYTIELQISTKASDGTTVSKTASKQFNLKGGPAIILDRNLNPETASVSPACESLAASDYTLVISSTDVSNTVNLSSLAVGPDVFGELDCKVVDDIPVITNYSISYKEKLGTHPTTGSDVFATVSEGIQIKKPAPGFEQENAACLHG